MIRGSPSGLGIDAAETQLTKIKLVDKNVNHLNRIVLVDPIMQAFGKKRRLPASLPSTKRFIIPRKSRENHITHQVFTQPRSRWGELVANMSGLIAAISGIPKCCRASLGRAITGRLCLTLANSKVRRCWPVFVCESQPHSAAPGVAFGAPTPRAELGPKHLFP
jgi:hypothetical protein